VTLCACLIGLAVAHGSGVPVDRPRRADGALRAAGPRRHQRAQRLLRCPQRRRRGQHRAGLPFTGGSRFIQNGVLSEAETARLGWALLALVVPAGLWLAWQSGPGCC
jgi:1,4-dihydroxy-2-naphthoate octaprenyltransferase